MNSFTTYLETEIGVLQIKGNATEVNSIMFLSSEKYDLLSNPEAILPQNMIDCKRQLEGYFAGKIFGFNFSFKQSGTPFQQSVWGQLQTINYGETSTYLIQSKMLGEPKNVRAVGNANGKNKLLIVVPCHRVVAQSGDLVGYSGELWRKGWLLKHEAKHKYGIKTLFEL